MAKKDPLSLTALFSPGYFKNQVYLSGRYSLSVLEKNLTYTLSTMSPEQRENARKTSVGLLIQQPLNVLKDAKANLKSLPQDSAPVQISVMVFGITLFTVLVNSFSALMPGLIWPVYTAIVVLGTWAFLKYLLDDKNTLASSRLLESYLDDAIKVLEENDSKAH